MWLSGFLWTWDILPILIWVTLPFNLLIYGINDIYDQDTDAENDRINMSATGLPSTAA